MANRRGVTMTEMELILEDGDKHKGEFQQECEKRFGVTPLFPSKKDCQELQAADLTAWKTRHPVREVGRHSAVSHKDVLKTSACRWGV